MPALLVALLPLLGGAGLVACGEADLPVQEEAATPAPAPAPATARTRVQGQWTLVLTPEEQRKVQVMQLALRVPPASEAELAAAALTEDEAMLVGLLAAARQADPQDPRIREMEAAVQGLQAATLRVTDTELVFTAGSVTEVSVYEVRSETGTALTVENTDKDGRRETTELRLEGPDVLVLTDTADPGKSQRFARAAGG